VIKRVFVDTSVFFSACYSQTGASFEIFRLALNEVIQLITSEYVLEETRRNLASKSPEDLPRFQNFLDVIDFEKVNPSVEEVLKASQYTDQKDAPVVAAAQRAGADFLASLDRRHLVGQTLVAQRAGIRIVLPEVLLREVRSDQFDEGE
jgi:putative PIN family toxin of toxin-antitoxin system